MNPNFMAAVQRLYPNVDFTRDVIVRDDGNGPYLYQWNIPNTSPPTDAQIAFAMQMPPPPPTDPYVLVEQLTKILVNQGTLTSTQAASLGVTGPTGIGSAKV